MNVRLPVSLAALAFAALVATTSGWATLSHGSITAGVVPNPLAMSLTLARTSVRVGDRVTATASAVNLGSTTLTGVTFSLRLDSAGLVVLPPPPKTFASLLGGASVQTSFAVCAAAAGNYVVLVHGQATGTGGLVFGSDSRAVVLNVTGSPRSGACH